MPSQSPRVPGVEQRKQDKILAAAGELFAASGYDHTTIRAIASAAGTDPGVVKRYFGTKKELFARVTETSTEQPLSAEQVAEMLLTSLTQRLEAEPSATLAMLRSMLTHPEAGEEVRAAITEQQRQAADTLSGDDAVLRTGLIGAITLGTVIGRDLLRLDGLHDAEPEAITAMLRPCFQTLLQAD